MADEVNEVFERQNNTRVARVDRDFPEGQVGAVVIFNKGIDINMALVLLAQLSADIESQTVREFDPENGTPVWYVP